MSMRRCLFGAAIALIACAAASAAPSDNDLRKIEDSLKKAGPDATLKKYYDCDNGIGWKLLETGDPRAVRLAFGVMPAADACYSEVMSIELGYALTANPILMMGYYKQYPQDFSDWCVPGLIGPTEAEWKAVIDKAEKAVLSVHDPALAKPKQICIDAIKQARTTPLN